MNVAMLSGGMRMYPSLNERFLSLFSPLFLFKHVLVHIPMLNMASRRLIQKMDANPARIRQDLLFFNELMYGCIELTLFKLCRTHVK
jgi:hypothetical protein